MHSESRYEQIFSSTIVFSLALIILGFIMDTPANILSGLYRIVTMQDLLITDYVYIAGAGARSGQRRHCDHALRVHH